MLIVRSRGRGRERVEENRALNRVIRSLIHVYKLIREQDGLDVTLPAGQVRVGRGVRRGA